MSTPTHFSGPVVGDGDIVVATAELDLTSDSNLVTVLSAGDISERYGGDVVVPYEVHGLVTETVAADDTAPIVTLQDEDGNSSGLTITLTDGDAADDYVKASLSDGDATTPVDVRVDDLQAAVTTAAADAGTATGKVKLVVKCLLIR